MEFKICTFYLVVCCIVLSSARFSPSRHDKSHSIRNLVDDDDDDGGGNDSDNSDDNGSANDDYDTRNIVYSDIGFHENPLVEEQKQILLREGAKIKRNAEIMRDKARPAGWDGGEELDKNTELTTIKNKMKTKKPDASAGTRRTPVS